jgi:hypothetical protein
MYRVYIYFITITNNLQLYIRIINSDTNRFRIIDIETAVVTTTIKCSLKEEAKSIVMDGKKNIYVNSMTEVRKIAYLEDTHTWSSNCTQVLSQGMIVTAGCPIVGCTALFDRILINSNNDVFVQAFCSMNRMILKVIDVGKVENVGGIINTVGLSGVRRDGSTDSCDSATGAIHQTGNHVFDPNNPSILWAIHAFNSTGGIVLRKLDLTAKTVTTVSSDALTMSFPTNAFAQLVISPSGDKLYMLNTFYSRILYIQPNDASTTLQVYAGTGDYNYGVYEGVSSALSASIPTKGFTLDKNGNGYLIFAASISKIDASTGKLTTFIGAITKTSGNAPVDGIGIEASSAWSTLAPDYESEDKLLSFEIYQQVVYVRRINPSLRSITTIYNVSLNCESMRFSQQLPAAYDATTKTYFLNQDPLLSWTPNEPSKIGIINGVCDGQQFPMMSTMDVTRDGKLLAFPAVFPSPSITIYDLKKSEVHKVIAPVLSEEINVLFVDNTLVFTQYDEDSSKLFYAPIADLNNITRMIIYNTTGSEITDYDVMKLVKHSTANGLLIFVCRAKYFIYVVDMDTKIARVIGGSPSSTIQGGMFGPIHSEDATATLLQASFGFLGQMQVSMIAIKNKLFISRMDGSYQITHVPKCPTFTSGTTVCSGHGECLFDDVCSCKSGYIGIDCSRIDPNAPISSYTCFGKGSAEAGVCSGGGNCTAVDTCSCYSSKQQGYYNGTQCEKCQNGYGGLGCRDRYCFNQLSSSTSVCSGHGSCDDVNVCTCFNGYTGNQCNVFNCYGKVKSDSTVCNGNPCISKDVCQCPSGYLEDCSYTLCYGVRSDNASVCSGNGKCNKPNICTCNSGSVGLNCNLYTCSSYISTDTRVCSGHGACTGPETCTCSSGYEGSNCDIPTCSGVKADNAEVCSGHGKCVAKDTCNCDTDVSKGFFAGSNCEKCQSDYKGNTCKEKFCDDANTCNSKGSCTTSGGCLCKDTDTDGHFAAPFCDKCKANYYGNDCKTFCDSATCNSNGDCTISGSCTCAGDLTRGFWNGTSCDTCQTDTYGSSCKTKKPANFKFSDAGNSIVGTFITAFTDDASCAKTIHPEDLVKLGNNARCGFFKGSEAGKYELLFGTAPTLAVSSTLRINVKFNEATPQYITVTVAGPTNSPTPTSVLKAPATISSCASVTLDGSASASGDGRAMMYSWSVTSDANITALQTKLSSYTSSPIVRLDDSDLVAGKKYDFSLSVTSFFGKTSTVKTTVAKSLDYVINIDVAGGNVQKAALGRGFRIDTLVRTAACFPDNLKDYKYTFIQTSGDKLSYRQFSNALYFDDLPKRAATYTFSVNAATIQNPSIAANTTVTFTTVLQPIYAYIYAPRAISRDDTLYLFGGVQDQNFLTDAPTMVWTCTDKVTQGDCPSALITALSSKEDSLGRVVVKDKITVGTYTVTLTVLKSSLVASTSVDITVQPGNLPVPRITSYVSLVSVTRSIYLWSYITNATSFQWYLNDKPFTGDNYFLVIPTGTLQPGFTYTVKLTASNSEGSASTSIQFDTNSGPQPGILYITPESGDSINTEYSMSANQWTSPLGRTLFYNFRITDPFNGQIISSTPLLTSNSLNVKGLPIPKGADNKLTIQLTVTDLIDEVTLSQNVTVTPPSFTSESEKNNAIKKQAEASRFLMGFGTIAEFGLLIDASISLFNVAYHPNFGRSIRDIESNVTSAANITAGVVNNILGNHRQMVSEKADLVASYFNQIAGNLINIVDSEQGDEETLQHIVDGLEEIITDAATKWKSPISLGSASQSYLTLLEKLRKQTTIPYSQIKNILRVLTTVSSTEEVRTTQVYSTKDLSLFSTRLDTDSIASSIIANTVKFPDALQQELIDRNITSTFDVQVVIVERNASIFEYTETSKSKWIGKTVSIELLSVENGTQTEFEVSKLSESIEITIPVEINWNLITTAPGYTPVCRFLDESTGKWITEGCSLVNFTATEVICSCNHLTTFTVTIEQNDCYSYEYNDTNVCGGHGECVGQDTCNCTTGFSGDQCNTTTTCFGINYNNNTVCSEHGTCTDTDTCSCETDYYGTNCSVHCNVATSCSNHGTCSENVCTCTEGYYGDKCQNEYIKCFGISADNSDVCYGNGNCTGQNTCVCDIGYYPDNNCSLKVQCNSVDFDSNNVCSENGNCDVSTATCDCNHGYGGQDCSEYICNDLLSVTNISTVCGGHGICSAPNVCNCTEGYSGTYCDNKRKCEGIDFDSSDVCSHSGNCTSTGCSCNSGYSGNNCELEHCFGIEPDNSTVCNGVGNCTSKDTCHCPTEYSGTQCETKRQCFGIDYDSGNVCSGKGSCLSTNNCTCQNDYYTSNCSVHCTAATCSNHGSCNTNGKCTCDQGFTGDSCENADLICFGVYGSNSDVCSGHGDCSSVDNCTCNYSIDLGYFQGTKCDNCADKFHGSLCKTSTPQNFRFADDGKSIIGEFKYPNSDSVTCANLIHTDDLKLLGSNPHCTLDKNFTITLGSGTTVLPGSTIRINVNVDNSSLAADYVTVTIQQPVNAPTPEADIYAKSSISLCAGIRLDASGSASTEGRQLSFKWQITDGPSSKDINDFLSSSETSIVEIASSLISNGTYTVEVTVTNIFNVTGTKTHTFKKVVATKVETEIITIPDDVQHIRSKFLSLEGRVVPDAGCPVANTVFNWTQLSGKEVKPRAVRQSLLFDAFTFPAEAGEYTFMFTAVPKGEEEYAGNSTVTIHIVLAPLISRINGGDARFSSAQTITLDASSSSDPENTIESSTFTWSCLLKSGSACPGSVDSLVKAATSSKLEFAKGELPTNTYEYSLTYSKGSRNTTVTTQVEVVVAEIPVVVFIRKPEPVIRASGVIGIQALVSAQNTTFQWYLDNTPLNSAEATATSLTFSVEKLAYGSSHTIKLEHTNNNGIGYAQTSFKLNSPPTGGTVTVYPSTGTELDTLFEISANSYVDSDTPLQYRYLFKLGNQIIGNYLSLSSSLKVRLPEGTIKVQVSVYDSYLDKAESEATITVNQLVLNATEEVEKYNSLVDSLDTLDGQVDLQQLSSVADAITIRLARKNSARSIKSDSDLRDVVDKLVSLLNTGVSSINTNDPSSQAGLSMIATSLLNVLSSGYVSADSENVIVDQLLERYLNVTASTTSSSFSTDIAQPLVTIFSKLLKMNIQHSSKIREYVISVQKRAAKDLVLQSSNVIDVEGLALSVVQYVGGNLNNHAITLSNDRHVTGTFNAQTQSNELYVISTYVVDMATPFDAINTSIALSPLVSIDVTDDSYNDVSSPVTFSTDADIDSAKIRSTEQEDGYSPTCFVFNTVSNTWTTDGCTLKSFTSTSASCSCDRKGSFIVALEYYNAVFPSDSPQESALASESESESISISQLEVSKSVFESETESSESKSESQFTSETDGSQPIGSSTTPTSSQSLPGTSVDTSVSTVSSPKASTSDNTTLIVDEDSGLTRAQRLGLGIGLGVGLAVLVAAVLLVFVVILGIGGLVSKGGAAPAQPRDNIELSNLHV